MHDAPALARMVFGVLEPVVEALSVRGRAHHQDAGRPGERPVDPGGPSEVGLGLVGVELDADRVAERMSERPDQVVDPVSVLVAVADEQGPRHEATLAEPGARVMRTSCGSRAAESL